jgi:GNAT superfamily N-acetyltransferase
MEEHELAVWATCVEAVAALPGNPMQAVIDHSGSLPLVALCAVDRGDINRVVALGVRSPACIEDLHSICSFYETHHQRNFRIEVTPLTRPSELARWITASGLAYESPGTFKMWRKVERPPPVAPNIEVRRLGPEDRDALTAINVAAWGAWSMPVSMTAWFGATVGNDGVRHYGVFDADRLVATGALFLGDGLGWLGFDATHPRYQGRKLRQAISSARMTDAASAGCQVIHAESAVAPSRRALRDGWRLLYEKQNFTSARIVEEVVASGSAGKSRPEVLNSYAKHG